MLQSINQEKLISPFPRINHEFIGLGRQLQVNRRVRRQADADHQSLQNRVLFLEKEQLKAKRTLETKKKKLEELVKSRKRKQQHLSQKQRVNKNRQQKLEQLKKQNEMSRLMHRVNMQNSISLLKAKNHSDYSRGVQQRHNRQTNKLNNKSYDLENKKGNWLQLNLSKQQGKMKINTFHKQRNQNYVKHYQSKIFNENKIAMERKKSMKILEEREQSLKSKLQNTNLKSSRVDNLISSISRAGSPMDIKTIQAQLFEHSRRKKSYRTLKLSEKQMSTSRTNLNSARTLTNRIQNGEYIEQSIQIGDEQGKQSSFMIVHKRRKNKHANRYKQYQAY